MEIPNDTDLTLKLPVTIGTIPWNGDKTTRTQQQQEGLYNWKVLFECRRHKKFSLYVFGWFLVSQKVNLYMEKL